MQFANVIGTVVCTSKVPAWQGYRLLLLQPTDEAGQPGGRPFVAIDLVSAAPGQRVFYVRGREAATAMPNPENPSDATIVGIVDELRTFPGPERGARGGA